MQRLTAAICSALLLVPVAVAHADHHGMAMEHGESSSSSYTAGVAVVAASFAPSQSDNMYYGGNYEAVVGGLQWAYDRFSIGASWAYYRVLKNGDEQYGVGDVSANAQVALVQESDLQAGLVGAVSVPTGNEVIGLGMGHTMLMPAAYAAGRAGRVSLSGSFGYSRALSAGGHVHGMEPLVEPMNMSELTWAVGGDVAIGDGVRGGARLSGGVPVGAMLGTNRIVGAVRVAWGSGRVDTGAELQTGLAGDPFTLRAVLSTALKF